MVSSGDVTPDWWPGPARGLVGLGGLVGGYLGARLRLRLPDRALRACCSVCSPRRSAPCTPPGA
ncbi:hypothetical protein [Streptomyces paradoxus]|uniref:hypothetical protein n=1 Tax=Streptomyces paradoxus TaxID=66375 RepID=UPI003806A08C